jgi:dienelactone hydrolase
MKTLSLLASLLLLATAVARAQSLPGLTITGNTFTYDAPDGQVTVIIRLPTGSGPFPAILISHGKGGSAASFSQQHAATLVGWGFVCIGPNYTHAGSGSTPDNEGYSPENSRRARRCLDILASIPGVDLTRVAAFGHSMGSFLTGGLLGEIPAQFRAACISAGGTTGTTNSSFASPSTTEVAGITAPLLMFHGTADTTVLPSQSANLQAILTTNGVPNKRLLYQGINHDIVQASVKQADIYAIMRAWFTQHGVLAFPGDSAPSIAAPASALVAAGYASPPLAVSIGDGQTAAGALTVAAFSTDDARLPNTGLALGGTGASRTLTITATAGQTGSVEIALVVSDGRLSAVTYVPVNIQNPTSDADADGLPLWWEIRHALDPASAVGQHGAHGNADGDALPNLLEFYFAQDSTADSSQGLPISALSTDVPPHLHFTYLRRTDAPWLTSFVEVTADFALWNSGTSHVQPLSVVPTGDGITERVTVRILPAITPAHPAKFARLVVGPAP